ncbi:MAG: ATPase, T2SS/T4P/T4SS family [Haloferacaceae archaeon]
MSLLDRLPVGGGAAPAGDCGCTASFEEPAGTGVGRRTELRIDATDCEGNGDLRSAPACRASVVEALSRRDADVVVVRTRRLERRYRGIAAALLVAAGRFRERVEPLDARLARLVATDPLAAVREATGRAGPVARIAAETGLEAVADDVDGYDDALRSADGVPIASARIDTHVPADATLRERVDLATGAVARTYDRPDAPPLYHLTLPSLRLDPEYAAVLVGARDRLRNRSEVDDGPSASRAVTAEAESRASGPGDFDRGSVPIDRLAAILRKHTRGNGAFRDLFADPDVSDAFVSAPVDENPVRVLRNDRQHATNVRMPPTAAATLASRLRRESGRGFSRADPTLDATLEIGDDPVRVAATTAPVTDGLAFAFRRRDRRRWTLPRLVDAGTVPAEAAGLLSIAVQRGGALLVAGGRGCGKTTLLSALLWELSPDVRTLVVEDTPELPVDRLQSADRDVQRLNAGGGGDVGNDGTDRGVAGGESGISPTKAVRTALRLGDGALVVGEVRGTEAAALYEAMRVGAQREAILGTIHGDGADSVRERVVSDLGVSTSSFASTDAVVTLDARYRLVAIEEIRGDGDDVRSVALFDRSGGPPASTGVIDRGNSHLLSSLARPGESYADLREATRRRGELIGRLAETDRHRPADVDAAVHRSGGSDGSTGAPTGDAAGASNP